MGFLKKELQLGLCVSLRERPLPSIFQNTGFGNGKICCPTPDTPGLTLDPHSPPPPPRKYSGSTHDYAPVIFIHAPPPQKKNKQKKNKQTNNKKTYGDGCGWSGQGAGLSLQCRGFNTGTVIFVILLFLCSY